MGGIQAGTEFAGGYFGYVWGLVGDHDYKRDCLDLPNVTAGSCCSLCPAGNKDVLWYDFRAKHAKWLAATYVHGGFDHRGCRLFLIDGCSTQSNCDDWMHDKPLGTDKVSYCSRKLLCMSIRSFVQ